MLPQKCHRPLTLVYKVLYALTLVHFSELTVLLNHAPILWGVSFFKKDNLFISINNNL